MNTTLLVLRLVPGLLLIGHGLQKLVPARFSPPLLHANGLRATGAGFEQLGIRPGVGAALLAGLSEVVGGFSLGAGLLTPVGTILIGAVMTTAILTAHARNGIWSHEGGFEFPLLLLALAFVISALGAGVVFAQPLARCPELGRDPLVDERRRPCGDRARDRRRRRHRDGAPRLRRAVRPSRPSVPATS